MGRARHIDPGEASIWLAILLEAAFSDELNATQTARLDLLGIAHDATQYPHDVPPGRQAALLLDWAAWHVDAQRWQRLQRRVRKRRQRQ